MGTTRPNSEPLQARTREASSAAEAAPPTPPRSRESKHLAGIAYGLGGASHYQGLDRSHAGNGGIRKLVDDSIIVLENRIAERDKALSVRTP